MPTDQLEDIAKRMRQANCTSSEDPVTEEADIDEIAEDINALMSEISEDIQKLRETEINSEHIDKLVQKLL